MKLNKHILIIALFTILPYLNILGNDFVWDDSKFVLDRPETQTFERSMQSFATDQFGLYRPVRDVFYFFTFKLFNFNPVLYHLFSILLHTISTILIYLIIRKIFDKKIAFFSSLIFAVHPIHIARVTNITGSFDLIGIVFMLGAFLLYINKKNMASIVFFILALFSSEEAFILPLLIIAYELITNKKWKATIYHWVTLVAFIILRFIILGISSRESTYPGGSLFVTMLSIPKVIIKYITLSVIPIGLTPFRQFELVTSFNFWFIIPVTLLVAFIYFAFTLKSKEIKFAILFFFITLLPFLNFLPLQKIIAERYIYLACLGIIIIGVYLLTNIKYSKYTISAFVIIFLALSFYNNTFWKDEVTLMNRGIGLNPASSIAHNNLGNYYFSTGQPDLAYYHFNSSVFYDKTNDKALVNLGVYYSSQNDQDKAIDYFDQALELDENNYIALEKKGISLLRQDKLTQAEGVLIKSITINPYYYKSYARLGVVYFNLDNPEKSIEFFSKAISINPNYAEPYYNLGILFENAGQLNEAQQFYRKAASLDPKYRK